MAATESIVCKPTPWFTFRAFVMLLMFGVFAVLFYIDGSTGYREKNVGFYLHKAFQQANTEFSRMNADGSLTAEAWKNHAEKQSVVFPDDRSVLPLALELPMPWPDVLHDFERMKPLQWNILWREYTKEEGMAASPPDEPFTARKIAEQWIVFWICLGLSLVALFYLVRTLGRAISADADAITTQRGRRIPYAELKVLDLRKWETKGLAFIDHDGPSGKGRIRLDGLTYGGFKKENQEPAERLMRLIRANFSGEIIEYTAVNAPAAAEDPVKPA